MMDGRVAIQLLADLLYIKGIICYDEFEYLLDIRTSKDAEQFTEKLLCGDFNVYKRGEHYSVNNE